MSDNTQSHYLENQFLIAMPQMLDSYFANTVTYLWKHNEQGALGIVINKPLLACISDIFDELDIECAVAEGPFREQHVLAGGPVERDKGFIIHDAGENWESSVTVTPEIRNLIREDKVAQMYSAIQTGAGSGMQTLGQCLKDLLAKGMVTREEAKLKAKMSENF